MKAVLNIVAAVLVAAGLVVTVASLLTPGHVILGIDFKLAAILVVGGLILHALASALLLLQRMSHDLRLLRKAGSEEPPWLRQAARSGIQAAAAAAPAAYAAAERAEAVREDDSAEPPEEVGQGIGGPPNVPDETDWPVVSEVQWPDVPEPEGPAEEEAESPFLEPAEPEAEPDAMEPAEAAPEEAIEPEPMEPVAEPQPEASHEPEPAEGAPEEAIGPESAEPVAEDLYEAASEPEPDEPRAEAPSRLRPSGDAGLDTEPSGQPEPEPWEAPQMHEEAPEEHAELYVVEERLFRGKQARVLSDGTIEAETAEGWMRFEDFDHLEEYLEAMAEPDR
jgi:hypothetical protein